MLHMWTRIGDRKSGVVIYDKRQNIIHFSAIGIPDVLSFRKYLYLEPYYVMKDVKECVRCGLRKGTYTSRSKWRHLYTGYFRDKKIVSWGKIPYKCYDVLEFDFLTEEEMTI